MAAKVPIRTVYTNSVATGLAEFQSGEFIDYTSGGTGIATIGSAGQVLKVNSGGSALEYGTVEAVINIDGMTDGSSATIAATDKIAFSDGGTEKYLVASQLDTYVSATTKTLTNKTLTTPQLTSPVLNTGVSGTAILDEDNMASDSATKLATQQSIKAYIATQVSVGDITSVVAGTGLTGGATSGAATVNVIGGTGITANADDIAIDSTVTTLTGSQTLTNKTLTSPTITGTGAIASGAITSSGVVTGTGFTIGSAVINEAELETIDGITAGTVAASKAVVVDSNKDIGTFRNLTINGVFTDGNYTFDTSGNVSGLGTIASGAITSSGVVTASGFTIGSAVISETELETIDGITAGTAVASKALIADSNIDISGLRNVTATGTVTAAGFTIGSAAITETELEILDGASVSTTELNYLDITTLGTSQASKAVTVDSSGDLIIPDSDKFEFGAGSDMTLYHDGTNSYITNKTGALKIATETSGIALTIGHTTSQVTIADNLTVVGNLTVTGTETIQDTVTMQAQNAVVFEGATADDFETTLTIVDPTADRLVYMPNQTGYLPLLSAASTTVITATPAELNYVDGVTSAIQTQMDTKSTRSFAIAQAVALG